MSGYVNDAQAERDRDPVLANACATCGCDGSHDDPLVLEVDGYRVHRSHTQDPRSGCYGTAQD